MVGDEAPGLKMMRAANAARVRAHRLLEETQPDPPILSLTGGSRAEGRLLLAETLEARRRCQPTCGSCSAPSAGIATAARESSSDAWSKGASAVRRRAHAS